MSETIQQPEDEQQPVPEPTPEPEPQPEPETPPEDAPAAAAASKASKRISHLSARANEATRRADEAERQLAEAKALLAQRGNGEQPAGRTVTDADVEALAERKLADRLLAQRRASLVQAGAEEFGADKWNEATGYLATAGLQQKDGFMEAVSDIDNAHQVLVALADAPDVVAELLTMRPVAMAARLGRMAAELSMSDKPAARAISKAPPPVRPVAPGRTAPPPDPTKMTSQQYLEFRKRTAPKHLGGQGQAA